MSNPRLRFTDLEKLTIMEDVYLTGVQEKQRKTLWPVDRITERKSRS
jgi:hypothetical protein